jgi:type II secretory ATPase GspE/PulE/Tfp pilus assembly ATPase PilB-like protein
VDEASGKTFSNILRSVLRQDPDVIMLGEIRDAETARTAMQAAITGHMVLSTVHTRDTLGTVFRLLDLGVEPYLVSQGLQIVVAQRLVRVLCPFCRRRIAPTAAQRTVLNANGQNPDYVYTAVGCLKCLDTGHAGRRAVFELLVSTDRLRDAMQRPNLVTGDLQKAVEGTQFTSLGQSGFQLVVDGIASFEEVERISGRGNRGE